MPTPRIHRTFLPILFFALFAAESGMADTGETSKGAVKKGLEKGEPLGAFYVTKLAGAPNDGVDRGESLCYRCRYGSRPILLIFARLEDLDRAPQTAQASKETGDSNETAGGLGDRAKDRRNENKPTADNFVKLLKDLDGMVGSETESGFRCLVTLLGDDTGRIEDVATELAERASLQHIPVAMAKQIAEGPENYRISKQAKFVFLTAVDSQVVECDTLTTKALDPLVVKRQTRQLLGEKAKIASRPKRFGKRL